MKQRNWKVGWNKSPEVWLLLSLLYRCQVFQNVVVSQRWSNLQFLNLAHFLRNGDRKPR